MTNLKKIDGANQIPALPGWADATKFPSKGKIVNFEGHKYQIVAKKERIFSCFERIGRIFLAAILTAISLGCLFKHVRHQFTKKSESIRYAMPVLSAWEAHGKTLSIRKAIPSDAEHIIAVAKSAFYDPSKPQRRYYRTDESREKYGKDDYPRRIIHAETYTVYVCTQEDGSVVGTAYFQFKNTDDMPKAEFGCFAIKPELQKGYEIGQRIFGQVLKEAQDKKIQSIYLYVVGPTVDGKHNTERLQKHYRESFGFEVTGKKFSGSSFRNEIFKSDENPEGRTPLIIMERTVA